MRAISSRPRIVASMSFIAASAACASGAKSLVVAAPPRVLSDRVGACRRVFDQRPRAVVRVAQQGFRVARGVVEQSLRLTAHRVDVDRRARRGVEQRTVEHHAVAGAAGETESARRREGDGAGQLDRRDDDLRDLERIPLVPKARTLDDTAHGG